MARDIGTHEFVEVYAVQKIEEYVNEIESLNEIAHTHPHACSLCSFSPWSHWEVVVPDEND